MLKKLIALTFIFCGIIRISNAQLSPQNAAVLMQKGINMGNTLEAPNGETTWGTPIVQEGLFDNYKNSGFNTVRIPVTWDLHTGTSTPFTIDASWMNRVEQVVDWALSKGLFVVINAHHEAWLKENYSAAAEVRFDSIWSQIARRFSNKSDKLLFEILNEPHIMTMAQSDTVTAHILPIIRKTNPTRIVIFQGPDWGSSEGLIGSAIPKDSFLMGSFHSYDPYPFGLVGTGIFGSSDIAALTSKFNVVKSWSVAHNIPVFLGEFGAILKADYNSVMKDYNTYVDLAQKNGFVYCAWEDGGDFKLLNRVTGKWNEIKDILIHSTLYAPKNPALALLQDTIIKLTWSNLKTDYDSIFIERRNESGDYKRVAALNGDSTRFYDTNLSQNDFYHYRVIAHYDSGANVYSNPVRIFLPIYVQKFRSAYLGTAVNIPGVIEAENFDKGGEGIGYHDSDPANLGGAYRLGEGVDIYSITGGYIIGNNMPGEWYEYSINVLNEADYNVDSYISALQSGGTFKINIGNVESPVITVVASTSWIKNKVISTKMHLIAGEQIMKFTVLSQPLFDIDKYDINIVTGIGNNAVEERKLSFFQDQNRELTIHIANNFTVKTLQVYNSNGSLIQMVQNPDHNQQINTSGMPSGLYIINAIGENENSTIKIVLN